MRMMGFYLVTHEIRAEMVASVLEIVAEYGQDLAIGDTVMLLESMKMEIPVLSESPGRLVRLPVSEGTTVAEGDLLAVVEQQTAGNAGG